ncbi:MAG: hypothetical protein NUV53_04865 [Patescibacteria group bacterium]|nr:hypothetical protein [Patescibacteria group bacterium]
MTESKGKTMIHFSNGMNAQYFVASGALAFDGKGWPWEWPLRWLGLIDTDPFAVVAKSLMRVPWKGNLRWWKPWECVRLIRDGSVNKVGLTNPGAEWWCREIGPRIKIRNIRLIVSLFGTTEELVEMTRMVDGFDIVGIEVNWSCPNKKHEDTTGAIIEGVRAVKEETNQPVIAKLSVAQDYVAIAKGLVGVAEAISINSVPWEMVYPGKLSPLRRLEKRVGGGGGGVSGKAAQPFTWETVRRLCKEVPEMPVIAPSIWEYGDIAKVRALGAKAESFGAIFLRAPWRPTEFVRREIKELQRERKNS